MDHQELREAHAHTAVRRGCRGEGRPPVVGMIGAGQLARMTAAAAIELGIRFRVLAAAPDESAAQVSPRPCSVITPRLPTSWRSRLAATR